MVGSMVLFGGVFVMDKRAQKRSMPIAMEKKESNFPRNNFMRSYFTTKRVLFYISGILFLVITIWLFFLHTQQNKPLPQKKELSYWLLLQRKSQKEYLFQGSPGKQQESTLLKTFTVKVGIPGERPTPLPQLLGREYWLLTKKYETKDNPETGPYFLELNIPVADEEPYGPEPYNECSGQCNWILPGSFGLHGVNGDNQKLSEDDLGSSGCVRHADEDITYLYTLLDPQKEQIRYYIEDI